MSTDSTASQTKARFAALPRQEQLALLDELHNLTAAESPAPAASERKAAPAALAMYELVFDGGSKGNPGPGYGSYRLTAGKQAEILRLTFGESCTNNEAEYQTLLAALHDLIGRIRSAGHEPRECTVAIQGDSDLVRNQVMGAWRVKEPGLVSLCRQARELVALFGHYEFTRLERERVVQILGH